MIPERIEIQIAHKAEDVFNDCHALSDIDKDSRIGVDIIHLIESTLREAYEDKCRAVSNAWDVAVYWTERANSTDEPKHAKEIYMPIIPLHSK